MIVSQMYSVGSTKEHNDNETVKGTEKRWSPNTNTS